MIQYTLTCEASHRFDAWFKSAAAYDEQAARGILTCPVCNSTDIEKALMAPAVATREERVSLSNGHPDRAQYLAALRELRQKMTANADDVGNRFAEEARKIHYEETEARGIYGQATTDEVSSLIDEGIEFMPLPTVPDEHN